MYVVNKFFFDKEIEKKKKKTKSDSWRRRWKWRCENNREV